MNLTLHMVGKDFRRLHLLLPLVGWWALVILQGFLISTFARLPHQPPPADMMLEFSISLLAWLVALLKIGLLVLIASQLVQQDSTVGSTAFWLSRPISGKRLLAGKSLFLALTVILPAFLTEVLLLLLHGVTLYDTVRSIPQILLFQCLVLALLMMLAGLTRDLARMIFLGILGAIGLLLVQYTSLQLLRWLDPYVFQPPPKCIDAGHRRNGQSGQADQMGRLPLFFRFDRVLAVPSCSGPGCCVPSVSDPADGKEHDPRLVGVSRGTAVHDLLDVGLLAGRVSSGRGNPGPGTGHGPNPGKESQVSSLAQTWT
ncbi:MAG: hypothetical protein F4X19_06900 [Acidobacteria bacterium]|nr:hypothetical protein [Acidobacteriota bacterium]